MSALKRNAVCAEIRGLERTVLHWRATIRSRASGCTFASANSMLFFRRTTCCRAQDPSSDVHSAFKAFDLLESWFSRSSGHGQVVRFPPARLAFHSCCCVLVVDQGGHGKCAKKVASKDDDAAEGDGELQHPSKMTAPLSSSLREALKHVSEFLLPGASAVSATYGDFFRAFLSVSRFQLAIAAFRAVIAYDYFCRFPCSCGSVVALAAVHHAHRRHRQTHHQS